MHFYNLHRVYYVPVKESFKFSLVVHHLEMWHIQSCGNVISELVVQVELSMVELCPASLVVCELYYWCLFSSVRFRSVVLAVKLCAAGREHLIPVHSDFPAPVALDQMF